MSDDIVKRLRGPHEWGYRDPVEGGFISDDAPFEAADHIERQAARIAELERSLSVCRETIKDQSLARADPTMPILTPKVREAIRAEAEAAYACADAQEDRIFAHGLDMLMDWQDRAAALLTNGAPRQDEDTAGATWSRSDLADIAAWLRKTFPRRDGENRQTHELADLLDFSTAWLPFDPPRQHQQTAGAQDDQETLPTLTARGTEGFVLVPVEPTEEMLNAARDWSAVKYGKPVGNEAARGCWSAMLSVLPQAAAPKGNPLTIDPDDKLTVMRAAGWSVAVHNDYRQDGEERTFWLFTHPSGRWVKGEGLTDELALELAWRAAYPDPAPPTGQGEAGEGAVDDWQPIETAPKDGTWVDLWKLAPDGKHGRRVADAKWDNNRSFASGIGRVAQPDAWVQRGDGLIYLDGGTFTHWMPLPTPPRALRNSAAGKGAGQ